jgi:hypothetical protein
MENSQSTNIDKLIDAFKKFSESCPSNSLDKPMSVADLIEESYKDDKEDDYFVYKTEASVELSNKN